MAPTASPPLANKNGTLSVNTVSGAMSGQLISEPQSQTPPSTASATVTSTTEQQQTPQQPQNGTTSLLPTEQNLANTKEKTPMCLINELARYNKVSLKHSTCTVDVLQGQATCRGLVYMINKTWGRLVYEGSCYMNENLVQGYMQGAANMIENLEQGYNGNIQAYKPACVTKTLWASTPTAVCTPRIQIKTLLAHHVVLNLHRVVKYVTNIIAIQQ